MEGWMVAIFVPTVVFVALVLPIWLRLHYRSKQKAQGALSEDERNELEVLAQQAQRMSNRIETLEAILDSETPGWRKRMAMNEQSGKITRSTGRNRT